MFLLGLKDPFLLVVYIVAILIAITIHEFSHAWMANFLGDPTAKMAGRLSLNPLVHLDPLGTIMLLIAGFGWGKPVPFNPYFLRRGGKAAPLLVALAGPTSNFLLAIALSFTYRAIFSFSGGESIITNALYIIIFINILLMIFNLLPIPPLDGSKIYYVLPGISEEAIRSFEWTGIFILFALIFLDRLNIFPFFSRIVFPAINFILSSVLKLPPLSI